MLIVVGCAGVPLWVIMNGLKSVPKSEQVEEVMSVDLVFSGAVGGDSLS
jgi:hypothetical protein